MFSDFVLSSLLSSLLAGFIVFMIGVSLDRLVEVLVGGLVFRDLVIHSIKNYLSKFKIICQFYYYAKGPEQERSGGQEEE